MCTKESADELVALYDAMRPSEKIDKGTACAMAIEELRSCRRRERQLSWVIDKAEELIRYNSGKVAASYFEDAWGELPKELQ